MSMGFQTFIKGTSFDVLNSMQFNYILDIINVSGSGNKSYSVSGFTLSAALINTFNGLSNENRTYTTSVSGQTVSWNVPNGCKLIVYAAPVSGSASSYFGFTLYDYGGGRRTFKLAPSFTPFVLNQVIDVAAGARTVVTNIPTSYQIMAFHRGTGNSHDSMWWNETSSGGNWAFQIPAVANSKGGRIYVFAKRVVNTPNWGFFLYNNGQVVWHSNCLPLRIIPLTYDISGSTPVAASNGVTGSFFQPTDPAFPYTGPQWFTCSSAGRDSSGNYVASQNWHYLDQIISSGNSRPGTWFVSGSTYIECAVYDNYYKQALGVS